MKRDSRNPAPVREVSDVVSVLAPGMTVMGDIRCDGTVRVEGKVEGSIHASKSVVIGKNGHVTGDIETQDAVIAGAVVGTLTAASRVELQDTCRVEGDIRSRRVKLDEGGQVEGRFHMSKAVKGPDIGKQVGASAARGPEAPARTNPRAAGRR